MNSKRKNLAKILLAHYSFTKQYTFSLNIYSTLFISVVHWDILHTFCQQSNFSNACYQMNFITHNIKKFWTENTGCVKLFFCWHFWITQYSVRNKCICRFILYGGVGQLCWLVIHIHILILAKIYGMHVYKSAKL